MAKLGKQNKYSLKSGRKKGKVNIDWKIIIASVVSILIVVCIYQFCVLKIVRNNERAKTIAEFSKSNSEFVHAFQLNKRIAQGTKITSADLTPALVTSAVVPSNYIKNAEQMDKGDFVARMDLEAKTTLTDDMFTKSADQITDSTKNQDYDSQVIVANTFMKQGQYIDIHFKKQDGTEYVVASKKRVIDLNGSAFSINITEKDRQYISNAIVRAALTKGSLYTTIYPDAENQDAATITYEVDDTIKNMIEKNPNIVKDAENTIKNQETKKEETRKPNFAQGGN